MKNIDFEDEYDPLLDIAEEGYKPSVYAGDVVNEIIKGIKSPQLVNAIKCVSDISTVPAGTHGDVVVETSTGNMYFCDGGCWVKLQ